MIETITKIKCDFCGIEVQRLGSDKPTKVDRSQTPDGTWREFHASITLRKGKYTAFTEAVPDLCGLCYNMLLLRTLRVGPSFSQTEIDILKDFAKELILRLRPQRKCPECGGKGRYVQTGHCAGMESRAEADCWHCNSTGVCPVPCSHDKL